MEQGVLTVGNNSLSGNATDLVTETTPNTVNALNRSVSIEPDVTSLQPALDEQRSNDTSIFSRFCELWLVRKIIAFFSMLKCWGKSSDSPSEETSHALGEEEANIIEMNDDDPLLDDHHVVDRPDGDEPLLLADDGGAEATEDAGQVEEAVTTNVQDEQQNQDGTAVNPESQNETTDVPENVEPQPDNVQIDETVEEGGEDETNPLTLEGNNISDTVMEEGTTPLAVDSSSPETLSSPVSPSASFVLGESLNLDEMSDTAQAEEVLAEDFIAEDQQLQLASMLSRITERTEPDSLMSSLSTGDEERSEAASTEDQQPVVASTSRGSQSHPVDDDDDDSSLVLFGQPLGAKAKVRAENDDADSLTEFEQLEVQFQAADSAATATVMATATDSEEDELEEETRRSASTENSAHTYTEAWIESSGQGTFVARYTKDRRVFSALDLNTVSGKSRRKARSEAASRRSSELSEELPEHKRILKRDNKIRKENLVVKNSSESRKKRTGFGAASPQR